MRKTLYIPEKLNNIVARYCKKRRTSMSEYVRDLMERDLGIESVERLRQELEAVEAQKIAILEAQNRLLSDKGRLVVIEETIYHSLSKNRTNLEATGTIPEDCKFSVDMIRLRCTNALKAAPEYKGRSVRELEDLSGPMSISISERLSSRKTQVILGVK